ncbi:MAG: alpha/beta hydrolase [Desulfomonilaceae bacterium]
MDKLRISRENVSIRCGSITLEGLLELPPVEENSAQIALILHPHPLYGGNMFNNVTSSLAKGLLAKGVGTLRFNFRGVGSSGGSHGHGVDEIDDVLAAISYIDSLGHVNSRELILSGYSFGCWVGLKAAACEDRLMRLIGMSPPVDMYDFSFLLEEKRPKLLIAGDQDFVCSKNKFLELSDKIPEPKRIVILEGSDHFHAGSEDRVVTEAVKFLSL